MSRRREPSVAAAVPAAPPLDRRIGQWPAERLVSRGCPVCDAAGCRPIVMRPDGLLVACCEECGMHYLPLVPADADLAEFYARYSSGHQAWQSAKSPAAALRAARRRRGGNGILREIAARRRLRGARLLELGCSRGSFLLDAGKAGAMVSGMEVDIGARAFINALGMPCHASMAEAFDAGPYDIVIALNLIEHLPQPGPWLSLIFNMLAPGGLVVLWTPNGGQAATLGAGWVGFRVDLDHLNYFCERSLSRCLMAAGLWPEASWHLSQASLAGFQPTEPAHRTLVGRLAQFWRPPVASWELPRGSGAYTLGMFAGKPG